MLLGCDDLSGEFAERYGLVNRVVPDAELDALVDGTASRVAALPPDVVGLTKLAVAASTGGDAGVGYALEATLLDLLKSSPAGRERMTRFLKSGAQTVEGESKFAPLIEKLSSRDGRHR